MKTPVAVFAIALAVPAFGYVHSQTSSGAAMSWRNVNTVRFSLDTASQAGMKNRDGKYTILPGSDPQAAVQAALAAWSGVSKTTLPALKLNSATGTAADMDGVNLVSFADTDNARTLVGTAIAVTMFYYDVRSGEIVDADIVFNPDYTFSTTPASGAFDIQSIATHELGHALGADHTSLTSSTMYPYNSPESTIDRTLSDDDIAFLRATYPSSDLAQFFGRITGRVTCSTPVCTPRAAIRAIDPSTGVLVECIAPSTGYYTLTPVPPGSYFVWVEPFDPEGFVDPQRAWPSAVYGGAQSPQKIDVTPAGMAQADFPIAPGSPVLGPGYYFLDKQVDRNAISSGYSTAMGMAGPGFRSTLSSKDVLVWGPGLDIKPDSLSVYEGDSMSYVDLVLESQSSQARTAAVIAIRQGEDIAFASGITVWPAVPLVKPAGVMNAASYQQKPLAPGELVFISGAHLGSDFKITFDGVAAPVLGAQHEWLTVQVPYEVAGKEFSVVHVQVGDASSDDMQLEVATSSLGLFPVAYQRQRLEPVAASRSARTISIYGTGQGMVNPPLATGTKAPANPLSVLPRVSVTLDGQPVPVKQAVMQPGSIGVFRIDVTIPPGLGITDRPGVAVTIGDSTATSGTIPQ